MPGDFAETSARPDIEADGVAQGKQCGGRETGRQRRASFNREILTKLWSDPLISTDRIAKAMGITRAGVSWHARQMRLPSRNSKGRRYRSRDPAMLAEMWLFGVSTREIAEAMGYADKSCVSRAARDLGLPGRKRGKAGFRNGGWEAPRSLEDFYEAQIGKRMAEAAARERFARRRIE